MPGTPSSGPGRRPAFSRELLAHGREALLRASKGTTELPEPRSVYACLTRGEASGTIREHYTPAMAKRFNVSIPDALAERMEPFKNSLSLSALMQEAIERELTRLSSSDEEKELRDNFKKTAVYAWVSRVHGLGAAVDQFIDALVDQASKDRSTEIFDLYRLLYMGVREDEIIEKLAKEHLTPEQEDTFQSAHRDLIEFRRLSDAWFGDALVKFVEQKARTGVFLFPESAYEKLSDAPIRLGEWLREELGDINNMHLAEFFFGALHSRISLLMTEEEISAYVCDMQLELLASGEIG